MKTALLKNLAQSQFWILAAALAVLPGAGCTSGEPSDDHIGFHTFLHEPHQANPPGSPVDVFTSGPPERPFDRVAVLDAHAEQQFWASPSINDVIPILKREARRAGCDAIIEIQEAKTPSNWTLETKVKHYTAIGIVYKRKKPQLP